MQQNEINVIRVWFDMQSFHMPLFTVLSFSMFSSTKLWSIR